MARMLCKPNILWRSGSSHEATFLCLLTNLITMAQRWQMMENSYSWLVKFRFCSNTAKVVRKLHHTGCVSKTVAICRNPCIATPPPPCHTYQSSQLQGDDELCAPTLTLTDTVSHIAVELGERSSDRDWLGNDVLERLTASTNSRRMVTEDKQITGRSKQLQHQPHLARILHMVSKYLEQVHH